MAASQRHKEDNQPLPTLPFCDSHIDTSISRKFCLVTMRQTGRCLSMGLLERVFVVPRRSNDDDDDEVHFKNFMFEDKIENTINRIKTRKHSKSKDFKQTPFFYLRIEILNLFSDGHLL